MALATRPRHRMAGRSLIELLATMMLALVLLASVILTVSGSGLSGRRQDASATIAENGQIAVSMIAAAVRMSGYWQPQSEVRAIDQSPDGLPMLRGCVSGFIDPAAAWTDLQCGGGAAEAGDAIAVRYQVGEAGTTMAMDCAARDLRTLGIPMLADRFYVGTAGGGESALLCEPTSGVGVQRLVDGVERLDVRYGVSPVSSVPVQSRAFDPLMIEGRTARYLRADELVDNCGPGVVTPNSWCAVTSVVICVLMRGDARSADEGPIPYVDCDGQVRHSNDQRIRRAVSTTVSLRNRLVPPGTPS